MALLNPLAPEQIDAALARLRVRPGSRVLDVGCGKGEVLARLVARCPGIAGMGVDIDPGHIGEARERGVPGVDWRVQDASQLLSRNFDVVICIGSTHALGGFPDALVRLRDLTRPGGELIIGEGFWRRQPDPEYLAALGARADELATRPGLLDAMRAAGLVVGYITEARDDSWQQYEERLSRNAERWASMHPSDPLASHAHAYAEALRSRWDAPGGRDTLGFALVYGERADVVPGYLWQD